MQKSEIQYIINSSTYPNITKKQPISKTITEASNILRSHCFNNVGKIHNNNNKQNENEKGENNKNKETPELSFAMLEGYCHCCIKGGHRSPECHLKDKISKEDWAINKAKAQEITENPKQSLLNTQSHNSKENSNSNESTSSYEGWSTKHVQFYQAEEMKNGFCSIMVEQLIYFVTLTWLPIFILPPKH
jgi:hypothetical protein